MRNYKTRRIFNICLAAAVAGSWLAMCLFGKGSLAQNGLGNLKFFTIKTGEKAPVLYRQRDESPLQGSEV